MSAKPITFTYPLDETCAINIDYKCVEYIVQWKGDWREIPDLTSFPYLPETKVTLIPHSSNVHDLWSKSDVFRFGADSHLRILHSCEDEFPICKVAINSRQRSLIQDEFSILQHLASQSAPVVRIHNQPFVDEGGIFGFRMQKLEIIEKIGATHKEAIQKAVDDIHTAGVVHHDLSPSNIMLTERKCIRVIDFGRAGYIGKEIPRWKLVGREPTTTLFSVDADLVKLKETLGVMTGMV